MMTLVTGAAASGKSEIAEAEAVKIYESTGTGNGTLYYIACMQVNGEEDRIRVERHKKLREGKGFTTLEKCTDIKDIPLKREDVVLVECMSNLLANEMFLPRSDDCSRANVSSTKIISDIMSIKSRCAGIVIVTNEVFSDGENYDEECMRYLMHLGQINMGLARDADRVIESVAGIPVRLK